MTAVDALGHAEGLRPFAKALQEGWQEVQRQKTGLRQRLCQHERGRPGAAADIGHTQGGIRRQAGQGKGLPGAFFTAGALPQGIAMQFCQKLEFRCHRSRLPCRQDVLMKVLQRLPLNKSHTLSCLFSARLAICPVPSR